MTSGQYSQVAQLSGGISSASSHQQNSTRSRTVCTPSLAVVVEYTKTRHAATKITLEKLWKATLQGKIEKSGMADHIWKEKGNHLPLWDEVKISGREEHWRIRRLKE